MDKEQNQDDGDIMTLDEASVYLRIPRSSLYKQAQQGKVSCQKISKHWRFHRSALAAWLSGQNSQPKADAA